MVSDVFLGYVVNGLGVNEHIHVLNTQDTLNIALRHGEIQIEL